MPDDMEFMDIRKGSDVEFGQSIYEPFGIAQLEPLTFGGICVFTGLCGCAGFIRDVTGGREVSNIILADYTQLGEMAHDDIEDLLLIDQQTRNEIECEEAVRVANLILQRLPRSDADLEALVREGYRLAREMSWDVVVRKYLLSDLPKVTESIPCAGA